MANDFAWYELMTTDMAAATAFYGTVVGWNAVQATPAYAILRTAGGSVGGLLDMPEPARKAGAGPAWFGYIGVEDVDAHARRVEAAGGAIHRPPEDIPGGVGRFAMVADPQGAVFVLFAPQAGAETPVREGPGTCGWRELMAGDGRSAFDFYAAMFGWTRSTAHDMGPMGVYQIFAIDGVDAGGIMTKPATTPGPHWNYYFRVPGAAAAAGRVAQTGGQVINGPMQVPGGGWVLQGLDPQGALFALFSDEP
jgi:hypothetical protein